MSNLESKALREAQKIIKNTRETSYWHNLSNGIRNHLDKPENSGLKLELQVTLEKIRDAILTAEHWLEAVQEQQND